MSISVAESFANWLRYSEEVPKIGHRFLDGDGKCRFLVKNIKESYWGDGATGYQLSRICQYTKEELAPFWCRSEELCNIYAQYPNP